jgi:hydroxyquinol 1,2-dioxygenase
MADLTEAQITAAALARLGDCADPRLRHVMECLVRHLHGFVREVEPSTDEWLDAIRFLTEVGHMCRGGRQEFILLSDVLGASVLVDAINNRKAADATPSTVLGPFYLDDAPELVPGADLAREAHGGESVVVRGRVLDQAGEGIAGALLDIWQTAANGLYDVQDPGVAGMNLRGRLHCGNDGRFEFRTVKPVSYPIPEDGPVGRLLRALGRHPYRPAHIHFIVAAEGYEPVVTQLFSRDDPYIGSDAVFGVKDALVVDFVPDGNGALALEYDFVLEPAPARP